MKINHEVVTQIGFKEENLIEKPNEKFYVLDHDGLSRHR
jgi:hypothetical protein